MEKFSPVILHGRLSAVKSFGINVSFPAGTSSPLRLFGLIYVLFYGTVMSVTERTKLEERLQLLEMQSHQFRGLQEYMRQTSQLRHDFRHSAHMLSALAENGGLAVYGRIFPNMSRALGKAFP